MLHHVGGHAIVIVSFYTLGWIQHLITTIWRLLPNIQIIVVDNNPDFDEQAYHIRHGYNTGTPRDAMIAAERYWLSLQPELTIVKQSNRKDLTHGSGMDLAKNWCLAHGIETMIHIEPDVWFDNVYWYEEQMEAIGKGKIVVGCFRYIWGTTAIHKYVDGLPPEEREAIRQKNPIHPACTAYYLPPLRNFSFCVQNRQTDTRHPRYTELVTNYYDMCNNGRLEWDTGHKIWFEAAKLDKDQLVNGHGMHHTFNSMMTDYWTRKPLEKHEQP